MGVVKTLVELHEAVAGVVSCGEALEQRMFRLGSAPLTHRVVRKKAAERTKCPHAPWPTDGRHVRRRVNSGQPLLSRHRTRVLIPRRSFYGRAQAVFRTR